MGDGDVDSDNDPQTMARILGEAFLALWMLVFVVWGVRLRWYPARGGWNWHPGWTYEGWRRHLLRSLGLFILIVLLVDLWYQLTGRGQFLH